MHVASVAQQCLKPWTQPRPSWGVAVQDAESALQGQTLLPGPAATMPMLLQLTTGEITLAKGPAG